MTDKEVGHVEREEAQVAGIRNLPSRCPRLAPPDSSIAEIGVRVRLRRWGERQEKTCADGYPGQGPRLLDFG